MISVGFLFICAYAFCTIMSEILWILMVFAPSCQKSCELIWFLHRHFQNHMNSFCLCTVLFKNRMNSYGVCTIMFKKPYEFIWSLSHHVRKPYEFIWFCAIMFKHHMNSCCLCTIIFLWFSCYVLNFHMILLYDYYDYYYYSDYDDYSDFSALSIHHQNDHRNQYEFIWLLNILVQNYMN